MTSKKGLTLALKGETDLVFTRLFDAPRELVYDCHTKSELMRRWLTGPDGWTFAVCDLDLKVGGKYLYVWQHATRPKFGMRGVFKEIVAPERLVNTESFVPEPDALPANPAEDPGAALNTLVLTSEGEATLMTLTCRYPSPEIRKMVMETGMETGMETSYLRLDAILGKMAAH
ncbi:MAG: SRPBCC family protein [Spirochaetia bacterium]|nr:SRPBCC family protein [Spirochaetia bacterium]